MRHSAYFPGLHGIRAIAALLVVFSHADQFARLVHLRSLGLQRSGIAGNAVDLFFVLSGFLITYLLLEEKKSAGRIRIDRFYLRRVLRIWPAYYTAIIVSCLLLTAVIVPHVERMGLSMALFIGLMANVAYALGIAIRSLTPLWSVGVEEQFYLLWPHLAQRTLHPVRAILIVSGIYWLVKLGVFLIPGPGFGLFTLIHLTRIDILCLGALGACWVHRRRAWLPMLFRRDVQLIAWLLFAAMCAFGPLRLHILVDQEVNALVFLVIILNVAVNKDNMVSLENPLLRWLGKISYGIYVYHMIVINVVAYAFDRLGAPASHVLWFSSVVLGTLLVAFLSYRYIESYFLSLKTRFAATAVKRPGARDKAKTAAPTIPVPKAA